jgi:magnesium-dependent phosphatase 1
VSSSSEQCYSLTHSLIKMSGALPLLVVFDLDDCLWSPEMYTLSHVPSSKDTLTGSLGHYSEGVVAVQCGSECVSDQVRLYPDALTVLQRIYLGEYPDVRIAAASSADTPLAVRIGRACMSLLEVLPGVTVRDVFDLGWPDGFQGHLQIGRTAPLTSDKSKSHFPILRQVTNIPYDRMVFFDDCNWSDHVEMVTRVCKGVVGQRTPRGLQLAEWERALATYAARAVHE